MKSEREVEEELDRARKELVKAIQAMPEDLDQESQEEIMAHGKYLGHWEGYEAALRHVLGEEG